MPRPRLKRLLRFSLRTMLVVVTVLCVLLAWKVRQVERQKEAVIWVFKHEGNVVYAHEMDDLVAHFKARTGRERVVFRCSNSA